jgi:phospholipid-binding lipoprotein MlaA
VDFVRIIAIILVTYFVVLTPTYAVNDDTDLSYLSDDYEEKIEKKNTNIEVYDPIEPVNRGIYAFNKAIDRNLLHPVARGYREFIPSFLRERVRNFLLNLKEPVRLVNNALQGDIDGAFVSFWRFTINTTIGLGGINDVTGHTNLKIESEDFGQTLGFYGLDEGPFLMLPLLGPSNLRDLAGAVVDTAATPTTYFDDVVNISVSSVDVINKREAVLDYTDDIEKNSFDPYSTYRSVYTQYRKNLILEK